MSNFASQLAKLIAEWYGLYSRAAQMKDELQAATARNIRLDNENQFLSAENQQLKKRIAELEARSNA